MSRLVRLLAPAAVTSAVALLLLLSWTKGTVTVVGGLLGEALYALVLQVALILLVVTAVDDLRPGAGWVGRRRSGRRDGWLDIASRPVGFSSALVAFYLRPFVPVMVLAFGVGVPVTAVVIDLLGSRLYGLPGFDELAIFASEAVLAVLWVLVAVLVVACRASERAAAGYVAGSAAAICLGELAFRWGTALIPTVSAWTASAVALSLLCVAAARVSSRRTTAKKVAAAEVESSMPRSRVREHVDQS